MFGLNDTTTQSNDDPAMLDNVKQLASEPVASVVPPAPTTPIQQQMNDQTSDDAGAPPAPEPSQPLQGFSMDPPTTPAPAAAPDDSTSDVADEQPEESSAAPFTVPSMPLPADDDTAAAEEATAGPDPAHLASMKAEALTHLEPLTDHIDGSPEEVFKTTMMMIQANDNHTLLQKALEAAKKIEDDKQRAQAMLDIINEINYFSQQGAL